MFKEKEALSSGLPALLRTGSGFAMPVPLGLGGSQSRSRIMMSFHERNSIIEVLEYSIPEWAETLY
jgi:hypothetical protein